MMFRLLHKTEPYASHQPILAAYAEKVHGGKIIEYGCGDFSTGLLHTICQRNNNTLITVESDAVWLDKVRLAYPGYHWHSYVHVKEFAELLDMRHDFSCDVAFIDSATWGSRLFCLQETQKAKHNYVAIVHDCDFLVSGHPECLPGYVHSVGKKEAITGEGRYWHVEKNLWPPTIVIYRNCMYTNQVPVEVNYDIEEI
jgi:hypothetical protein